MKKPLKAGLAALVITTHFFVGENAAFAQSAAAKVIISGKRMSVNGTTEIPIGMFGVHSTPNIDPDWGVEMVRVMNFNGTSKQSSSPNVNMLIDCQYDRFVPALVVSNPSTWKSTLEKMAEDYATSSLSSGRKAYVEFFNEPFLNWAYKPGVNYDPRWYETNNIQEDDPVFIKGSSTPTQYLVWKKGQWYDPIRVTDYPRISQEWNKNGGLKIGQTYGTGSTAFTVIERLMPTDTTQKSYYSGLQNAIFYDQMFKAFGQKAKSINPALQMIGGWGFEVHKDDWAPWRTLFKPMIDDNIDILDGIHEHHYGMDTRVIAADYETMAAYIDRTYNKRIKYYNTETGGQLDPQRPDSVVNSGGNVPNSTPLGIARGAMTYHLRDIIYMLDRCPDKAYSRAIHQANGKSDGFALRMLKPLRGNLMQSTSSDGNLYSVSSQRNDTLTVVVFNDSKTSKEVTLEVSAPQGTTFTAGQELFVKDSTDNLNLAMAHTALQASGSSWKSTVNMSAFSARTYIFRLSNEPAAQTLPVNVNQYFAKEILLKNKAGETKTVNIPVEGSKLATAKFARLKLVLAKYDGGGTVKINGKSYNLDEGLGVTLHDGKGPGNQVYEGTFGEGGLSYHYIDVASLTASNDLAFTAGSKGYELWMASIELIDGEVLTSLGGNLIKSAYPVEVYPNPFNTNTSFNYALTQPAKVNLQILNIWGQVIKSIQLNALESGRQQIIWDGSSNDGVQAKAGTYFYRLAVANQNGKLQTQSGKLIKHH